MKFDGKVTLWLTLWLPGHVRVFINLWDRFRFSHGYSYNVKEDKKIRYFLAEAKVRLTTQHVAQKDRNSWADDVPNHDWVDF